MTSLPAPIARTMTREEAEQKAKQYIKPGHRVIKKEHGYYQGKEYNYVVYVK